MTREDTAIELSVIASVYPHWAAVCLVAIAELTRVCEWTEDSDGMWRPACHGRKFDLARYSFCQFCGGQLVERLYVEPVEAE